MKDYVGSLSKDSTVTAHGEPVKMGVVNVSKLYIRRSPVVRSNNDNVAGVLSMEERVYIMKENSNADFMKVRTEKGIEGFVMKKFIRVLP